MGDDMVGMLSLQLAQPPQKREPEARHAVMAFFVPDHGSQTDSQLLGCHALRPSEGGAQVADALAGRQPL
jgi:hypothetical protein